MSEQEKIADAIRASHAAGFAQGYAAGIKAQIAAAALHPLAEATPFVGFK